MRWLFASVLACSQIISAQPHVALQYPTGGEILPINGKHAIGWTNSPNLNVTLYLDWYATNDALVTGDNALYSEVLESGTNSFIFKPLEYSDLYRYKVRLVSTNATTNIVSSSGFVNITEPASFTGEMTGETTWIPGQNKTLTISWNGFANTDSYKLILESPSLNKVDYGFLLTNVLMGNTSGTQTISVPYPSFPVAAYPPSMNDVADGRHSFTLVNERCGIVHTFGAVDVIKAGLRMYLVPGTSTNVVRGDSSIISKLVLDASIATNEVHVSSIKLVLSSFSSNWLAVVCNLFDRNGIIASNIVSFHPQNSSNFHMQVTFPVNLNLAIGETRELAIHCEILGESETGSFILNTENISTNIQPQVAATYIGGVPIPVAIIYSTSAYMHIGEIINPKFVGAGSAGAVNPPGGASTLYNVICKANTSYLVQSSTNLLNWDDYFTTNSSIGLMQIVLTNQNPWCFFRLKEN